jgi:nicotinate-nucleotide adenylyltransferase
MGFLSELFNTQKHRIAIFGGAFDPPTIGHSIVIDTVRHHVGEVWVLPAFNHFHGKEMTDFLERFSMCGLAFNDLLFYNNCVSLHTEEYINRNTTDGTAFNLLKNLDAKYGTNNVEFLFVIGQDNADKIKTWKNYEELIKQFKFIIIPRIYDHEKVNELHWYHNDPHIFLKELSHANGISSTKARQLIKEYYIANSKEYADVELLHHIKTKITKCIDSQLMEYILANEIYKD